MQKNKNGDIANVSSLDTYTRCSVCSNIYKNKSGSTSCCGAMNVILNQSEIEKIGVDFSLTKNHEIISKYL